MAVYFRRERGSGGYFDQQEEAAREYDAILAGLFNKAALKREELVSLVEKLNFPLDWRVDGVDELVTLVKVSP